MKKIISVLGILAVAAGLSACNTMRGVGKDIERGGEKMQGAATNVQQGSSSSGSSTSRTPSSGSSATGTSSGSGSTAPQK